MNKYVVIKDWIISIAPNHEIKDGSYAPTTYKQIAEGKYEFFDASVPGNFELDLMRKGKLPDLYYADNILKAQDLENMHVWYAASFDYSDDPDADAYLVFEGIDTVSEIYIDGIKYLETDNMFLRYEIPINKLSPGRHDICVHIIPAMIAARDIKISAASRAHLYDIDRLKLRKAAYMFGWDIMPRIVSAGIWKDVFVEYRPKTRIDDVFIYTKSIDELSAELDVHAVFRCDDDFLTSYSYEIDMSCGDSKAHFRRELFSCESFDTFRITSPFLWNPKNYGEQNLYNVTFLLKKGESIVDSRSFLFGIRIVEIERSSVAGENGEFLIKVNGKRIFAYGSNLVPTDAFPSRMPQYNQRCFDMLDDLGCNIVRCWGGNVYPDNDLFDFCDKHGIMVWLDFSMACARYPEDKSFIDNLSDEVTYIVKKFRNRASLAIWSGDNECDDYQPKIILYRKRVLSTDPNTNAATRGLIPYILRNEDFTRPYLPSSPYIDESAFISCSAPSEQHIWGPRDFFKSDFYVNSSAHFASETGYHGCPSPDSLKKFISPVEIDKMGTGVKGNDNEWQLHGSSFKTGAEAPYSGRIAMMVRQVERLFVYASDNVETFALQSQISQAEAKKFFIEHFRSDKWRRTGILWWNLIDGWPQISDAVVDWYGCKKLAYHYIKRSQQPFLIMFDEPRNGTCLIKAINDLRSAVSVDYSVREINSNVIVSTGSVSVEPDEISIVDKIRVSKYCFYLIEWSGDIFGSNHYVSDIYSGLDFDLYVDDIKKCGFYNEISGFNDL